MISPVGLLLLRTVASSSTKALGVMSRPPMRKFDDYRAVGRFADQEYSSLVGLEDAVNSLTPDDAARVQKYLRCTEFETIITRVAVKQLLSSHGGNADKYHANIREELSSSFSLLVPNCQNAELVTEAILRSVTECLQEAYTKIHPVDRGKLSPIARAMLVRSASDMAAAAARNADLLKRISDLSTVSFFEKSFVAAVESLNGTMKLPHIGSTRQVPFDELYVQPRVAGALQEGEPSSAFASHGPSLTDLISNEDRLVILGDPGSGKTTFLFKLVHDIATKPRWVRSVTVPFLIVLRDYAPYHRNGRSIIEYIVQTCKVPYSIAVGPETIEYILLNGRGLVCFDGMDELLDTSYRHQIVAAIEGFSHHYPNVKVITTSRRIGYAEAALDENLFQSVEIGPFNSAQITDYVEKWFRLDGSVGENKRKSLADTFLSDSSSLGDLTSNPLMLSLMCGLYAFEGYLPRNRPEVYEKCALLLFERWDKHRGIKPEMAFSAHVQSALRAIAYRTYADDNPQATIHRRKLEKFVKDYLLEKRFDDEDDAEQAAIEFVRFCRGRAWVLTDVGADYYGFTHRTFLEYFTASHLVRTHIAPAALLSLLSDRIRKAEWDVVCQLSLQMLGRDVDDGADKFLQLLVTAEYSSAAERHERLNIASFAVRALSFIVPRPTVIKQIVATAIEFHLNYINISNIPIAKRQYESMSQEMASPLDHLLDVADENQKLASKYYFDSLRDRLAKNSSDAQALALGIYLTHNAHLRLASMPSQHIFWSAKLEEFESEMQTHLLYQAVDQAWAASRLVVRGALALVDAIDRHGFQVLLDATIDNDMIVPPLAFIIFSDYSPAALRSSVSTNRRNLVDLFDHFASNEPPWYVGSTSRLVFSIEYPSLGSAGGHKKQTALLFTGLIRFELAENGAGNRASRELEVGRAMHESPRTQTPAVQELLRKWARCDINFVNIVE